MEDIFAVVLGVHRSGISMPTTCQKRFGLLLDGTPVSSTAANPRGFFEHPAIRACNDRLLHRLKAHWDFVADAALAGPIHAAGRREAAENASRITPHFATSGTGVDDPAGWYSASR